MSLQDAIQELLQKYPNASRSEIMQSVGKRPRQFKVYKDLVQLVQKHNKVSLKRLRQDLTKAYKEVHPDPDPEENDERDIAPYRKFVKEQTEVLKTDVRFVDQRERMKEIGSRWKEHKIRLQNGENSPSPERSLSPLQSPSPPPQRLPSPSPRPRGRRRR